MRIFQIFFLIFLFSCSSNNLKSNNNNNLDFSKNMSFEEFDSKLSQYVANSSYPILND